MQRTNYSRIFLFGFITVSGATCHELVKERGGSGKYQISSKSKFLDSMREKSKGFIDLPIDVTKGYNNSTCSYRYQKEVDTIDNLKNDRDLSSGIAYDEESISSLPIKDNPIADLDNIEDFSNLYPSDKGKESSLPIQDNSLLQINSIQDPVKIDKPEEIIEEQTQQFILERSRAKH